MRGPAPARVHSSSITFCERPLNPPQTGEDAGESSVDEYSSALVFTVFVPGDFLPPPVPCRIHQSALRRTWRCPQPHCSYVRVLLRSVWWPWRPSRSLWRGDVAIVRSEKKSWVSEKERTRDAPCTWEAATAKWFSWLRSQRARGEVVLLVVRGRDRPERKSK